MKVVYLDTQDYSRFGDVIRGRGQPEIGLIFEELCRLADSDKARFVCSLPLLSELLQYSADTRPICLAKAEAIERLCGSWAVPAPSRLIGMEIADCLIAEGLAAPRASTEYVNSNRYWYPNVQSQFENIRGRLREEADKIFYSLEQKTFTARRKLKAARKKFDLKKFVSQLTFEEAEQQLGLPAKDVRMVMVPLLNGRIKPEEASKRLMSSIAHPVRFVDIFFEKYDGDTSVLPQWLRGAGEKLKAALDINVAKVRGYEDDPEALAIGREIFRAEKIKYRSFASKIGNEDFAEFAEITKGKITDDLYESVLLNIPSADVLSECVHGYLEQIFGFAGKSGPAERSLAGDLIHSLYIPHVELWRGDRRFAALAKKGLPQYADRIVGRLSDLPDLIS